MTDVDPGLPDLDAIPTQPPPPPPVEPVGEVGRVPRGPRPPRVRASGTWWRVLALILATQAALVGSALLVAVERPSEVWAWTAVGLTDVFLIVAFSMMLGLLNRSR